MHHHRAHITSPPSTPQNDNDHVPNQRIKGRGGTKHPGWSPQSPPHSEAQTRSESETRIGEGGVMRMTSFSMFLPLLTLSALLFTCCSLQVWEWVIFIPKYKAWNLWPPLPLPLTTAAAGAGQLPSLSSICLELFLPGFPLQAPTLGSVMRTPIRRAAVIPAPSRRTNRLASMCISQAGDELGIHVSSRWHTCSPPPHRQRPICGVSPCSSSSPAGTGRTRRRGGTLPAVGTVGESSPVARLV